MNHLNRRNFLKLSAGVAGISTLIPHRLHSLGLNSASDMQVLGFQSWTIREQLVEDFAGTLNTMAGMGYKHIEMCSPPGYAFAGFGALQDMPAKEMKSIMDGEGITCNSCHYLFPELKNNLQERMEYATELGQKQMVLSSFGLPGDATLDDWKLAAEEMNGIGEQTSNNGIQLAFHNHHGEFAELEGELIYDVLLQIFDPELVKLQFQVAVITIGYKAADYFRAHPGRFVSAHLADWSTEKEAQVPLGQGIVDWPEFFEATEAGGVQNCFVEMPIATLEESAKYLKDYL